MVNHVSVRPGARGIAVKLFSLNSAKKSSLAGVLAAKAITQPANGGENKPYFLRKNWTKYANKKRSSWICAFDFCLVSWGGHVYYPVVWISNEQKDHHSNNLWRFPLCLCNIFHSGVGSTRCNGESESDEDKFDKLCAYTSKIIIE